MMKDPATKNDLWRTSPAAIIAMAVGFLAGMHGTAWLILWLIGRGAA